MICINDYDREMQIRWREFFGGSGEYPYDIRQRLDAESLQTKSRRDTIGFDKEPIATDGISVFNPTKEA